MEDLAALERRGETGELIEILRQRLAEDRRRLADPWVQGWCGRRFRGLFVRRVVAAERGHPRRVARRLLALPGQREDRRDAPEARVPLGAVGDVTVLFCPGLLNGLLPVRAFASTFPALEATHGLRVLRADLHPLNGCAFNAERLRRSLEEGEGLDAAGAPVAARRPPGDVVLFGYSKGLIDALTLLADRPDLARRVRAVIGWAGAVGGSYAADQAYRRGLALAGAGVTEALAKLPRDLFRGVARQRLAQVEDADVLAALGDLTTERRRRFLADRAADLDRLDLPVFQLAGVSRPWRVPLFQVRSYLRIARLGGRNDMQLTPAQARLPLPLAVDLATVRAHHWDLAYPPFPRWMQLLFTNLGHPFPRRAAVTAVLELLAELGLLDPPATG